jgi:hypothetical protein
MAVQHRVSVKARFIVYNAQDPDQSFARQEM